MDCTRILNHLCIGSCSRTDQDIARLLSDTVQPTSKHPSIGTTPRLNFLSSDRSIDVHVSSLRKNSETMLRIRVTSKPYVLPATASENRNRTPAEGTRLHT